MITRKTPEEIKILEKGGKILSQILAKVTKKVKSGVSTAELESLALRLIQDAGGKPSFKGYKRGAEEIPFPTALCISINNEVVHAPALPSRALKSGDTVSFDVGMEFNGLYTDMANTIGVGKINRETKKLIKVAREALVCGIGQVKPKNFVGDISRAVQSFVEKSGFSVIRDLVGHGVGYAVHEGPQIPNYFEPGALEIELEEGMVLALEPMVTAGDWRIKTLPDGWTVATVDGSLAAHFEATVAVTGRGHKIITPLI